jgi:hypothetical protein
VYQMERTHVRGLDEEWVSIQQMGQGGEEQCQLRFHVHIHNENGFCAGRKINERGYLDIIELNGE